MRDVPPDRARVATHGARRTEGVSVLEEFWPVMQSLQVLEQRRNADVDPSMRRWQPAYPLSIGRRLSTCAASPDPGRDGALIPQQDLVTGNQS